MRAMITSHYVRHQTLFWNGNDRNEIIRSSRTLARSHALSHINQAWEAMGYSHTRVNLENSTSCNRLSGK